MEALADKLLTRVVRMVKLTMLPAQPRATDKEAVIDMGEGQNGENGGGENGGGDGWQAGRRGQAGPSRSPSLARR